MSLPTRTRCETDQRCTRSPRAKRCGPSTQARSMKQGPYQNGHQQQFARSPEPKGVPKIADSRGPETIVVGLSCGNQIDGGISISYLGATLVAAATDVAPFATPPRLSCGRFTPNSHRRIAALAKPCRASHERTNACDILCSWRLIRETEHLIEP